MLRILKRLNRKEVAQPPGTLKHIGEKRVQKPIITRIRYTPEDHHHETVTDPGRLKPRSLPEGVEWINIDGIHDITLMETIGSAFAIHPLVLEDILNTTHLPKSENFEEYLFVVVKMLDYDQTRKTVHWEQVSFILTGNTLISFQERPGDIFEPVRARIRNQKGRLRKRGADYLLYALLDALVDNYFVVMQHLGDELEAIEDRVINDPGNETLRSIHRMKRELVDLRKALWPLREVILALKRDDETNLVAPETQPYLRDLYDHTIHVIETIETFRDMLSGIQDLHLTGISNRMNEIMKVLTIIATIFIPLTFIAGIYGMNFNPGISPFNMPELNWKYGYLFALGLMTAVGIGLFFFFKRKKWW